MRTKTSRGALLEDGMEDLPPLVFFADDALATVGDLRFLAPAADFFRAKVTVMFYLEK